MKASIFVLIDALGWEWIKEHPFLKEVAPYRRPLDSVLGFSTAAIPSILTGRFPDEHGRLSLFHRANGHSPFAKLSLICAMPPAIVENRYARFAVKTLARRINHLSGYFQLYGIPLKYLPKLDVCEKRNIYEPGGIPDSISIFDLLERNGTSYKTYCYHDGPDDQLLASIEADLRAGGAKFYFLYLAELDHFLHLHADDRAAAAQMLEKYSTALARLHKVALETYGAADIHVFGDHGMAPTRGDDRHPGRAGGASDQRGRLLVPAGFHDGALLVLLRARPRIGDQSFEGGRWRKMARRRRPQQAPFIFSRREVRRADFSDRIGNGNCAESHGCAGAGRDARLSSGGAALAVGVCVERRLWRQHQSDHRPIRRDEGACMTRRNR